MLSAHLANIILHHTSMSRPFLRLIGLLCIASLEVGWGIYRRYAPPEPEKPQISFAAHLAGVLAGLTFGLVILRNYEQKLSERKAWWLTMCLLLGLSFTAFLYQRLRNNPAFTLLCTDHPCPSWPDDSYYYNRALPSFHHMTFVYKKWSRDLEDQGEACNTPFYANNEKLDLS